MRILDAPNLPRLTASMTPAPVSRSSVSAVSVFTALHPTWIVPAPDLTRSLRVRSGAGTIHVGWSAVNTLTADTLDLETGAGVIEAVNLGKFGASKIRIHSGAGTIKVDFGDKVDHD